MQPDLYEISISCGKRTSEGAQVGQLASAPTAMSKEYYKYFAAIERGGKPPDAPPGPPQLVGFFYLGVGELYRGGSAEDGD
jgi:hypothetical protein